MNIRNAKHFDLDGFHPNIGKDKSFGKKSAKSSKHDMIKYVTKDGDYIEFGIECKKYMECVKDKRAYICSKLINGEMTLVQAVEESAGRSDHRIGRSVACKQHKCRGLSL